jgi:hypothetical protein
MDARRIVSPVGELPGSVIRCSKEARKGLKSLRF